MFKINEKTNAISITKGDNAFIQIDIKTLDQQLYEIKENDIITLTVRKTAKSDVAFKESAVGNIISIVPTDTNSLATGLYVYDVQLTTEQGLIRTVIPASPFYITEEVTY